MCGSLKRYLLQSCASWAIWLLNLPCYVDLCRYIYIYMNINTSFMTGSGSHFRERCRLAPRRPVICCQVWAMPSCRRPWLKMEGLRRNGKLLGNNKSNVLTSSTLFEYTTKPKHIKYHEHISHLTFDVYFLLFQQPSTFHIATWLWKITWRGMFGPSFRWHLSRCGTMFFRASATGYLD